jgi:hypothetical protein
MSAKNSCVTLLWLSGAPFMHISGMVGPVFFCTFAHCKAGNPQPDKPTFAFLFSQVFSQRKTLTDLGHNSNRPNPFPG